MKSQMGLRNRLNAGVDNKSPINYRKNPVSIERLNDLTKFSRVPGAGAGAGGSN